MIYDYVLYLTTAGIPIVVSSQTVCIQVKLHVQVKSSHRPTKSSNSYIMPFSKCVMQTSEIRGSTVSNKVMGITGTSRVTVHGSSYRPTKLERIKSLYQCIMLTAFTGSIVVACQMTNF